MQDHTIVFLSGSRQETRYIDQTYNRNIECIAETHETSSLAGSITVENTGQIFRLVSDNTDRLSIEAGKTDDDIFSIISLYFQKFTIIDNSTDYFVHVVRTIRAIGNNFVERIL